MDAPSSPNLRSWTSAPELQDDRQAYVLYSPFREKALNPHSWDRKMRFWEGILTKMFMEQRVISFDVKSLPDMFERNGLTPKCLTTVIEEMKRSGQLQPGSHYQKTNSWLSWGFNALVKQPLVWGVTQLMGSVKKGPDVYVCPKVVKAVAEEILQQHRSSLHLNSMDSLMSLSQLRESCRQLIPQEWDFEIVLALLEKDKEIAVMQTSGGELVVKFRKEGESAVSFRDIDLNVYSIKTTMEKLEKDIQVLSSRVNEYLIEAKIDVKAGRKRLALLKLRRKASLLKMIDRKSGSLTILHDIVQKMEDAKTNEMVMKACEAGVQAMKALNEEVTTQRAEAVMDELQEAISDQEEINDIISSPTTSAEEEELERDLADLLREDTQRQLIPDPSQLPSVPAGNLRERSKQEPGPCPVSDDIAAAFLSLEIDDLGLPDVPTHSPSKEKIETERSAVASAVPSS